MSHIYSYNIQKHKENTASFSSIHRFDVHLNSPLLGSGGWESGAGK